MTLASLKCRFDHEEDSDRDEVVLDHVRGLQYLEIPYGLHDQRGYGRHDTSAIAFASSGSKSLSRHA